MARKASQCFVFFFIFVCQRENKWYPWVQIVLIFYTGMNWNRYFEVVWENTVRFSIVECVAVSMKRDKEWICVYMRTECLCGNLLFSRKRTKIRKKTKYTILDNIDEQERMELRPKYGKCSLFQLGIHSPSFHFMYLNWHLQSGEAQVMTCKFGNGSVKHRQSQKNLVGRHLKDHLVQPSTKFRVNTKPCP